MSKLIGFFKSSNGIIDLKNIEVVSLCVSDKDISSSLVYYSLDNVSYFKCKAKFENKKIFLDNIVCRYIKFDYDLSIKVYSGTGYIGKENKKWNKLFVKDEGWTGGDGLYSFNIDGVDNYLSEETNRSICVFGDTFYSTLSLNNERLAPLAMPNNSYCELSGTNINNLKATFHVNEDDMGHCIAYLTPSNDLAFEGTMASNLVNYNLDMFNYNYLSSYNPKKPIELKFDFNATNYIDHIDIYNYFMKSKENVFLQNRGIKEFDLYIDDVFIKNIKLKKVDYDDYENSVNHIKIKQKAKSIKFVIPNIPNKGNFGGVNKKEGLYGLNKIYFYKDNDNYLIDVKTFANSEFSKKDKHAWFWLQDGIVLNSNLYSLPFVVTSDLTQPEGFQFKIEGIALTKTPIINGKIDFSKTEQKMTNLYRKYNGVTYNLGACFFNNTLKSKEKNPDGYIYIYGYMNSSKDSVEYGNQLIVSRIKEDDFPNLNKLTFYSNGEFVSDILKATPVLNHVSCEMSVSQDNGKYIAIFTYDVQSRYIAYSISLTPYGPFEEIHICYVCKENLCPHMYLYNAKAHPHLSHDGNILVSYNVNTSNFDENIKFGRTYGPRFLNLKRVGGKENENKN